MAILQNEDDTNLFPRTYTPKVFDKNGHSVVDRLAYIEEDDPETVEPMSPYLYESDVVNNFTDGGSDVPLSAECGKTLYNTLSGLIIIRNYSATYSIAANGTVHLSANDLQITWPSGYIPLSVYELTSGYQDVLVRNIILSSTGTDHVLTLRNISNVAVNNATLYLTVKYIKSSVQG